MFKWIRLIRFIKKYRKLGVMSFKVITNGKLFVIWPADAKYNDDLRIKY